MKIGITDYAEKYIEEHTIRKRYYSEESYNKLKKQLEDIRNYIERSDLGKMLWGKELMKILDKED